MKTKNYMHLSKEYSINASVILEAANFCVISLTSWQLI
jgi:hypothetical protein